MKYIFLNNCNEISLYLQPFLAHNSIVTFGRNVHLISIKFLKQMRIVHYNAIHKKTCKSHKICSLHAKKLIFSFEFHLKMQWRWRRCTVALGADRMPKVSVGYSNRRRLIILWRVVALQKKKDQVLAPYCFNAPSPGLFMKNCHKKAHIFTLPSCNLCK